MIKEQTVHLGLVGIDEGDVEELTTRELLIPIQRRIRALKISLVPSDSKKGRTPKGLKKSLSYEQSRLDNILDDIKYYSYILSQSIDDCRAIKDELKFIDMGDSQFDFLNNYLRKAEDEEIPRLQAIVSGLEQESKALSRDMNCFEGEYFQIKKTGHRKVQKGSRDYRRKRAIARRMRQSEKI